MSVQIHIPTALRAFTERQAVVLVEGATVAVALEDLTQRYPGLARHLRDEQGRLRSFVNVYLGEEDVRHLPDRDQTPLADGANLLIVPSIAGGAR
jgi:molybdopterin synthase sulfur carrier subunit